MKRKRFTEEQIITILKEHEAGSTVVGLARYLDQLAEQRSLPKTMPQLSPLSAFS